ncbi:MAG: transcriptional repressor [Clostridia bacterium]|nr:transcriptional repressor [Clostridia bacterium]
MNDHYDKIKNLLIQKNIRPSMHRIKILEYLLANETHPTADRIYNALSAELPTVSRMTVYNTLAIFTERELVHEISIGENESRYDIVTEPHGHFKCTSCGTIYNFDIKADLLASIEPVDFKVMERDVYFKGICPKCL